MVSVVGIAVATAAILCVLSVFNGFRDILSDRADRLTPDLTLYPTEGKTFTDGDRVASEALAIEGVDVAAPFIEERALAIYGSREMPVTLYAVDFPQLQRYSDIDSIMYPGSRIPQASTEALLSPGVASSIQAYESGNQIFLFAPRRVGRINPANPAMSFLTDSVVSVGIFESGDERFDKSVVMVSPEVARGLLMYDSEATGVAIRTKGDAKGVKSMLEKRFGDRVKIQTREEGNEINYRMVNIEKWVTFLLLSFILLIASFNIISTMGMFALEKRKDSNTLLAMGMTSREVGDIFALQSIYITLIGVVGGLLVGVGLCLLQQHYGLLTMGDVTIDGEAVAYPVRLMWGDLPMVLVPVLVIGGISALVSKCHFGPK